jgi:membrane-anchored glycerophosphoryl diester phosphodiesterase (GDPDase)
MFIIFTFGINNEKGRNVAASILAIAIISEVAKYYFELGYEKEYIAEVTSEDALIKEWEIEKQRYDRKEIILRIVFVIAMLIPILLLRF